MKFDALGLAIPDILLPTQGIDLSRWAVVACDQYSSEPEYWQQVAAITEGYPSTANLIFPEAYLNCDDAPERIDTIHRAMETALAQNNFREFKNSLIACERRLSSGQKRQGVMVALDLEQYDYRQGSQTLIRATEGTIVDRLPPRIKIRQAAPLELPHIMVLIDDPAKSVIEPLFTQAQTPLYDFSLMQNGGKISGYLIDQPDQINTFAHTLAALAEPKHFQQKYGINQHSPQQEPLLYAMGDGNHSFATARAIWENMKTEHGFANVADHPARYALVELVNLYDESLQFEAIHRVVFNTQPDTLIQQCLAFFKSENIQYYEGQHPPNSSAAHTIGFHYAGKSGALVIQNPSHQLAVGSLQTFLDAYLADKPNTQLDYIHGEDTTRSLGEQANAIGFLLPAIKKESLFKTVIFDGALPRKTFSMGDAQDKRFYLEARKISLT